MPKFIWESCLSVPIVLNKPALPASSPTNDMEKIALVTGASGVIGQILVRHLLKRGYIVRALLRPTSLPDNLPPSVAIIQGDITNVGALRNAVGTSHVVFHLAAKLHAKPTDNISVSEYEKVNLEGTRCLVEAARLASVRRLVFFSTINVYGPTQPGQIFDEDSPLQPESPYARTKRDAEVIVLAGLPAVVLRLAAVYGPGMKGNYLRLLQSLRARRFIMVGDGDNRRTLVHVNDVCQAAFLAAEHPGASGQIYNVTDGDIHTLRDIIEAISQALGKAPPRFRISPGVANLAARLLEAGFAVFGNSAPPFRTMVEKIREDVAVSGAKLRRQLGYHPEYSLACGWHDTVQHLFGPS